MSTEPLFPSITPPDWPKHLQLGRQRRAGAVGRINLAKQQYTMTTKNTKTDDRTYGTVYRDPAMEGAPDLTHDQLVERFKSAYGINVLTTKGTKTMTMHMDGADWFSSSYEWDVGGHKFYQHSCHKRSKADAAYWQ